MAPHSVVVMPRKKKTKIKPAPRKGPAAFGEFKIDDCVWAKKFKTNEIVHGKIHEFYPDDNYGPAVQIYDEINGSFRTVLIETVSFDAPKGGKRKLLMSRAKLKK